LLKANYFRNYKQQNFRKY